MGEVQQTVGPPARREPLGVRMVTLVAATLMGATVTLTFVSIGAQS